MAAAVAVVPPARAASPALVQVGTFAAPVYVGAPLGDTSRVFVVEREGTVRLLKDGVRQAAPFLDISPLVSGGGERGLLSIAFDLDYAATGRFWVYYTAASPAGRITIDEFRRSAADPDVADPASRRTILTIPHASMANHNGGQLQVGPAGELYAATGDGGGAGDPSANGQRLTGDPSADGPNPLLGKVLRIDPRAGSPYAIPAGQPIVPGAAPEIFAYGLRNPFRFSFDRATGDLTIGDVGQSHYEEIDFAPRSSGGGLGVNFGWNRFEGRHTFDPAAPDAGTPVTAPVPGFTFGVIEYDHTASRCSVTGGYVVRDPALPELAGRYLYGDFCEGTIMAADLASGQTAPTGLRVPGLSSFGEDACGRIYVTDLAGPVHRLSTSGACAGPLPFAGHLPAAAASAPTPATTTAGPDRDTAAPVLGFSARTVQHALRTGRLRLTATCSERCRLTVSGTVGLQRVRASAAAARTLRTAGASRTLAAGARVRVDVRIGPRTRRTIRRSLARPGRRATAALRLRAEDAAGNAHRRAARIRIARH